MKDLILFTLRKFTQDISKRATEECPGWATRDFHHGRCEAYSDMATELKTLIKAIEKLHEPENTP